MRQRKGWFKIPGVQDGDRTLEQQMTGVTPALAEASGKTVLDLGCAEGLMSREFARAGAASVFGIDTVADHIEEARRQCKTRVPGQDCIPRFQQISLDELARKEIESSEVWQYDIVLALGVCQKLPDPAVGIEFAARAARSLVLIRMHFDSEAARGLMRSKHHQDVVVDVNALMRAQGFEQEKILPGPYRESTVWWRRAAALTFAFLSFMASSSAWIEAA